MADGRTGEPEVRRRRPRVPAGIPYATVEAVSAELHGIGQDGIPALRARLHSLRRLDFPNGVSSGSGRHFAYGLAEVIALQSALELAEAYVPPAAAAAIVREGWPEIARCALAGLDDRADPGFATVHPNALLQALEHAGRPVSDTLHVEIAALAAPLVGGRSVAMAAGATASRTVDALRRLDPRSHDLARSQVAELRARFGDRDPLPPPASNDGRLISDGPYWGRARSLVGAVAGGGVADADQRRALWQLGYLAKPAPVEAWKRRVEVHPELDDVGFAAAVATLAHRSGLRSARVPLSTENAERAWRRMTSVIGDRDAIVARLVEVSAAAEAAFEPAAPPADRRRKATGSA